MVSKKRYYLDTGNCKTYAFFVVKWYGWKVFFSILRQPPLQFRGMAYAFEAD